MIVILRIRIRRIRQSEIALRMGKINEMHKYGHIFGSENPVVGTLNLCRETTETPKKESG